jgi:hypothetical protein
MASGGTTDSGASNPFGSQQNTQQPQQNTQQNNPQSGFGPQQFGPQLRNPFGRASMTISAPQTPFGAPAAPFFGSQQQSPYVPAPAPAPAQPNLSDAIGQLKSGNQSDAQNMLRQIIGLPPIQAAPYNPNPGLSDAFGMMAAGNPFGAEVRACVPAPAPAIAPIARPTVASAPPPAPIDFASLYGSTLKEGGRV